MNSDDGTTRAVIFELCVFVFPQTYVFTDDEDNELRKRIGEHTHTYTHTRTHIAVLLTSHSVICSVRGRKAGTRLLTGQHYVSMNAGSHSRLINRLFLILLMELFYFEVLFSLSDTLFNSIHGVVFKQKEHNGV